jgi:hypothetical protein
LSGSEDITGKGRRAERRGSVVMRWIFGTVDVGEMEKEGRRKADMLMAVAKWGCGKEGFGWCWPE